MSIPHLRHAELVSASILRHKAMAREARWTLKQVQGDDTKKYGKGINNNIVVISSKAKQSRAPGTTLDCRVAALLTRTGVAMEAEGEL